MAHFPRIVDRSTELVHVHFVHVHCTFGAAHIRLHCDLGHGAPTRTPSSLRAPALRSRPEYPGPTRHIVFVAMSIVFLAHSSYFLRPWVCSVSQQMAPAFGRVTAGRSTFFGIFAPLPTSYMSPPRLCSNICCRKMRRSIWAMKLRALAYLTRHGLLGSLFTLF